MPRRRSRKSPITPDDVVALADFIADSAPVVGDGKAVYEVSKALREEDWQTAALSALGFIPVVGDAAKRVLKADITGVGARQAERKATNPTAREMMGANTSGVPTAPKYQRPNTKQLVDDFNNRRTGKLDNELMELYGTDEFGLKDAYRELIDAAKHSPESLRDMYPDSVLRELSKYGD